MLASSEPNVHISQSADAIVVRLLQPKVFNDQKMEEIIHELRHLADKLGKRDLRIDLGVVKYLQSSALGKLVTVSARVKAAGGRLVLCNVHPTVARVLSATRLDQLLTVETVLPDEEAESE